MDDVEVAYTKDWGPRAAAVSRSPEGGEKIYGLGREKSLSFAHGGLEMQADVGSLRQKGRRIAGSEPHGGGTAVGKRHKSFPQ